MLTLDIHQYALGDFAVRQAGKTLNKPSADIAKYANRSMNFVNHWDSSVTHDGFKGFSQRKYPVCSSCCTEEFRLRRHLHSMFGIRTAHLHSARRTPARPLIPRRIHVLEDRITMLASMNVGSFPQLTLRLIIYD